jgi:HEPN domain-containing protein
MNRETIKKWILKAENDLKIAKDEMLTENPATDAICFHAQQCVEKYLKAYLISKDKEISKTHDILFLIKQCLLIDNEFNYLLELNADSLTSYAVEIRYPDDFYFPSLRRSKRGDWNLRKSQTICNK